MIDNKDIEKLKKMNSMLVLDNKRLNRNFKNLQSQINRLETLINNVLRKG